MNWLRGWCPLADCSMCWHTVKRTQQSSTDVICVLCSCTGVTGATIFFVDFWYLIWTKADVEILLLCGRNGVLAGCIQLVTVTSVMHCTKVVRTCFCICQQFVYSCEMLLLCSSYSTSASTTEFPACCQSSNRSWTRTPQKNWKMVDLIIFRIC